MKLVLATPLYPPEIGGPATYAKELVEGLPARGIEVELVKFSDVRNLPKLLRHYRYYRHVLAAARDGDIVFVQDTVSCGLPARLAAWRAGKPLIVRVPGDYVWEQARQRFGVADGIDEFQGKQYGLRVGVLRFIQRGVVRSAARVIVPSEYFAGVAAGWGVPRARIAVIYNGIHLPLTAVPPREVPEAPFMVSVGRLVPWKGFAALIRILATLPAWRLVIIGDGPNRAALEQEARAAGVADRVRFVGALPNAEAVGWYRAATAFVLNSSFESFSFQVAEAMAVGARIIATDIGSIPELVEDGQEGLLIRPDDEAAIAASLELIRTEPAAAAARAEAAREKARRFSSERTFDALATLLGEVAAAMLR
ncbi:MAG TPA: glycosyltransferase family 4 protein [Candidatus Paceibacterota bacterium]|nr:glycosyltransferase family 4 protein [Candidatus Paceibacterota bacterium]